MTSTTTSASETRFRSASELGKLDLGKLLEAKSESFLGAMGERAQAGIQKFKPITVEERLRSFQKIGYRPHGLYLPNDEEMQDIVRRHMVRVGAIESEDERLATYFKLQAETDKLCTRGVPGHWTGQMGVARSPAPYRIVAWGRRGGKSFHAAREAVGVAVMRPRSWIWLAAPIMKLVDRVFEMALQLVQDLGLETRTVQNSQQSKLIVLRNGSKIEGVSLENYLSAAGASVDFAIIDEAAQIVPDAWYRAIQPPLADRNGQALLISSFEGEGDFFHTQVVQAQAEDSAFGTKSDWSYFQDASWDINFFVFPQGRQSAAIKRAERHTPPLEFLELYGAIPAGARERVYPEFRERAHVGDYRFDPNHPVVLAVDPSSGINQYAVVAIQNYDTHFVVFWEFYEVAMTAEEISPILKRQEWWKNVTDVIIDTGAGEDEILRWQRMGWPAYGVPDKPNVEERIPLQRNMLRDPARFHRLYRKKVNEVLKSMSLEPDSDLGLPPEEQRKVVIQVEESLADHRINDEDLKYLKTCARYFVAKTCTNTIAEHKTYSYQKRRKLNANYREIPRDFANHIMDSLGYFIWTYYRWELSQEPRDSNITDAPYDWSEYEEEPPEQQAVEGVIRRPGVGFLQHCRDWYSPDTSPDRMIAF